MGFSRIGLAYGLAALSTAVRHGAPMVIGVVPVAWSQYLGGGMEAPAFLSAFTPRAPRAELSVEASSTVSLDSVLELVWRTSGGTVDASGCSTASASSMLN